MKRIVFGLALLCWSLGAAAQNCIPSGVSDQYTYFVAVDSSDKVTREPGLSTFTVIRSRNGAADAAFNTPTVSEIDSSTMPGVYALLLDEDMTIAAGNDVEHMALHITHAGMEPVTKEICVARAKITQGETLSVTDGNPDYSELAEMLGIRTTVSALSSQTEFTPAALPTSDGQLVGWGVLLRDAGDAGAYSLRKVVSVDTGEVTINKAPDFTLASSDVVVFLPAFTNEPVETVFVNCEVNTANFAGSTTTVACILTDRDGAAITAASGDLTGLEFRVTSGAQVYEARFINSTTWDDENDELQLTLSRALPSTLADGVTAIIR
jgi:hypothetical protein